MINNIREANRVLVSNDKLLDGMNKYKQIMESLHHTDVSTNVDFQRAFNRFFMTRPRTPLYYDKFYSFLEARKNIGATFEEALKELKSDNGKLEISFSSKAGSCYRPYPTYMEQEYFGAYTLG